MFQRIKTFLKEIDGSIWFYLSLFAVSLFFLRFTFFVHPDTSGDFWGNVRVEFVGFCFDVFLLGLIFSIFMQRYQRKQDIKRWQEEIDDYRGWDEKEATHRIVGNIRRLNKMGVKNVNLRRCYLAKAYLLEIDLEGADLTGANLEGADLRLANLENANFNESLLQNARLDRANLKNTSFGHSHLESASLTDTNLEGSGFNKAHLAGAYFMGATNLEEADFSFSYLEGAHFDSIEWLDKLQKKDAEKKGVKLFLKYYAEPSIFGFTIKSKT